MTLKPLCSTQCLPEATANQECVCECATFLCGVSHSDQPAEGLPRIDFIYLAADEREGKNRRWEARERSKTYNQGKINGCRETEDDGMAYRKEAGEKEE